MNGIKEFTQVLWIILVATAIIQLCIYWIHYRRLAFFQTKQSTGEGNPVSIIICARNEAIRLRKYLLAVLEQEYSKFEVIVVNDCSWDETATVLDEYAKEHPHLKIVTIKEQEKYRYAKKFALTLGIKAASNELLLFTDADCRPEGNQWLNLMQRNFDSEKEIVLGYGAYSKAPGFLNKLIRFDTLFIAMQYFSSALGGNPYMGIGRNLAYKKSLFFRNKGFAKHNHILSGDDDLFVNENATKKK